MRLLATTLVCLCPVLALADLPLDVTKHGIVYRAPGMDAVKVQKDISLPGAPRFDLYKPAKTAARLPVVVFVNGVGDPGGNKLKDWEIYRDWSRLLAAHGYAAIIHEAAGGKAREQITALLERLNADGVKLGLDPDRIAVWACSANVTAALPVVMDGAPRGVRAAVFYYGAGTAKDMRKDLPVYWVLAGRDDQGLINAQRELWRRAVERGLPWTMVNAPTLPHAFDAVDTTPESLRIVAETLAFFDAHLGALPAPPAPSKTREILSYIYAREPDKAESLLEAWTTASPRDVDGWLAYGAALQGRKPAEAVRVYQKALELEPDNLTALRHMAVVASQTGGCVKHADVFARIGARAKDPNYLTARATCETLAGKRDAAVRTIDEAVAAGAAPGNLHYNLACSLALSGRADDALGMLEKAVEKGWSDGAFMAQDSDLTALRDRPRFKALVEKLKPKG